MSLNFDILMINTKAKEDAQKGNKIINACLGALKDNDHKLLVFQEVIKALKNDSFSFLEYAPVLGTNDYKIGVCKWLFKDKYEEVLNSNRFSFCATMGGTGALFSIFKIASLENATLFFGDIVWPNYVTIAKNVEIKTSIFALINNNEFNFEGFKEKILEELKTSKKVYILLNDPCENPIGYSFSKKELDTVWKFLKNVNSKEHVVDLIVDIAYIDYSNNLDSFLDYVYEPTNFNVFICFSASKSFGVYGIRCGALLAFGKDEETAKKIKENMAFISRGTISNPNHQAIGPLSRVMLDENSSYNIKEEIKSYKSLLNKRGQVAIEYLKKYKVDFLPYSSGFFVTIKTKKDAYQIISKLMEKHIYLVPISGSLIRLAICSINEDEIKTVIKEIASEDKWINFFEKN